MATKTKVKWPEEVEIPTEVGRLVTFKWSPDPRSRVPNCALGHAVCALGGGPHSPRTVPGVAEFECVYSRVAATYKDVPLHYIGGVAAFNDNLASDFGRALVYNATWAYLGYTEGQSKEVLALAEKALNREKV